MLNSLYLQQFRLQNSIKYIRKKYQKKIIFINNVIVSQKYIYYKMIFIKRKFMSIYNNLDFFTSSVYINKSSFPI